MNKCKHRFEKTEDVLKRLEKEGVDLQKEVEKGFSIKRVCEKCGAIKISQFS